MSKQRAPLFVVDVKGGLGKKELSRLVGLVFEDQLTGFTFRQWSTCHIGIKHISNTVDAKADEGWKLSEGEVAFYIDPLCEQVLKHLAGQGADLSQVRWRATTRWVGSDILLEVQLEPD